MDLTLVEKITQVLQSTQIRIKSEVLRASHSVSHTCQQSEPLRGPSVCLSVHLHRWQPATLSAGQSRSL